MEVTGLEEFKGNIDERIRDLRSEIDREFKKPNRNLRKMKKLWWEVYRLENHENT